jgi:hypothetical protein
VTSSVDRSYHLSLILAPLIFISTITMRIFGSAFHCFSILLFCGSSSQAESFSVDASATITNAASTVWKHVEQGPPDAILGIAQAFRACVSHNVWTTTQLPLTTINCG